MHLLNGPTEFGAHHPAPLQFTSVSRKVAREGDILFCVRGSTTGRMNWADQEYAIGRGVAAIRHREDIGLQPLVRGVIELALPDLLAQATGSTFSNVSTNQLGTIPFPALDPEEQWAIAHVLGTLDDKIDLNRRMCETLEVMARALFRSWFVDFEPVLAKMEGRWRLGESLPGLPAEHYHLFLDTLVPSPLGDVPEGWEVRTLGDVVDLNPEVWTARKHPEAVNYIDLANTKWGIIEVTQEFSWENAPSRARRVLKLGDTIVGTVRPGNGSYAFVGRNGLTGSTGFAVLRSCEPHWCGSVYLSATAPDNIRELAHLADGAAYPAEQPEVVAATEFVSPIVDDKAIRAFSSTVGPLLAKMEIARQVASVLAAQRDGLLPRLVSGEVSLLKAGSDNAQ